MADQVIVPEETELTAPYWQGAREGELRIQRCGGCDVAVHPPQPVCPRCHSAEHMTWEVASGRAEVYAATVVEHAAHPAVVGWLPYTVLLVRLDEGPLLITAPAPHLDSPDWPIGTQVQLSFVAVAGTDSVLPYAVAAPTDASDAASSRHPSQA